VLAIIMVSRHNTLRSLKFILVRLILIEMIQLYKKNAD
jgi:hypothetical protein